jgi:hypothetical protein
MMTDMGTLVLQPEKSWTGGKNANLSPSKADLIQEK